MSCNIKFQYYKLFLIVLFSTLCCKIAFGDGKITKTIRPPINTPSHFLTQFGSSIASSYPHIAIYSPAHPLSSPVEPIPSFRTFIFGSTSNDGKWTFQSSIDDFTNYSSSNTLFDQSQIEMNSKYLIISQPWSTNSNGKLRAGRVLVSKSISSNSWSEPTLLAESSEENDQFGTDISIFNEWIVVSAAHADLPYIKLFQLVQGEWTMHSIISAPNPTTVQKFGLSVDLRHGWLVVGAPGVENVGAVFVYKFDSVSSQWNLFQQILPSTSSQRYLESSKSGFFGSKVALKTNLLFVANRGTAQEQGRVSIYSLQSSPQYTWSLSKIVRAPLGTLADDFGISFAASDENLAISDSPASNSVPSIHVFRKCGTHSFSLYDQIKPDSGINYDAKWAKKMIFSGNSLFITSKGQVDLWDIPAPTLCGNQYYKLPPPDCCDQGINVIVSDVATGNYANQIRGYSQSLQTSAKIIGNLTFENSSTFKMKSNSTLIVQGHARFAGKLIVTIPYLAGPPQSAPLDSIITYYSRSSHFDDIQVVFEDGRSECARITVEPVYTKNSLSLIVHTTTPPTCSNSNPLIPVYIALSILIIIVIGTAIAFWKVPRLRAMMVSERRPRPSVKYSKLDDDDDDENQNKAYSRFSGSNETNQEDTSLGAEIDEKYNEYQDENEDDQYGSGDESDDLESEIPESKIGFVE